MPYIPEKRRKELGRYGKPENAGELNYRITQVILEYMESRPLNYQRINDILGALDGASREFYDRVARPYEDKKIEENGDVYHG